MKLGLGAKNDLKFITPFLNVYHYLQRRFLTKRKGFIFLNKCANLLQCDWAHRKS